MKHDYKKTYCNPLSMPCCPKGDDTWAVMDFTGEVPSDYRSISDPSVLYYENKWYLYPSYGMAYVSEDFINWEHVRCEPYNMHYSPCVVPFGGKFLMTSHSNGLYEGDTPVGPFRYLGDFIQPDGSEYRPVDPALFVDDDGRLYLYCFKYEQGAHKRTFVSGSYGVELCPDNPRKFVSDMVLLNEFDPKNEWERYGERRQDTLCGWVEGQWMYKKNGRYYLIYASSGTEFGSYCMAAYYSDESPLSGFVLQKNNPITESRNGIVRGAGHGCVVDGPNDTIWAFFTVTKAYTHVFERCIGMDVLAINKDGELYAPHGVSDTPQYGPGVADDPVLCNDAGLYPLTLYQRNKTKASSQMSGHEAFYALDESMLTFWQPCDNDECPCISVDLEAPYNVCASRIIWRDIGLDYENGVLPGPYKYIIEARPDDDKDEWVTLFDCSDNDKDLNIDYRTFDAVSCECVRLKIVGVPKGLRPAVVSFTVFGTRDETL
ncbi:MAG: hypothetical protein E7656_08360 [Ruminococcaceae bacterium]|nr:hypothetical protein [Oscillospiraceae bacterium]